MHNLSRHLVHLERTIATAEYALYCNLVTVHSVSVYDMGMEFDGFFPFRESDTTRTEKSRSRASGRRGRRLSSFKRPAMVNRRHRLVVPSFHFSFSSISPIHFVRSHQASLFCCFRGAPRSPCTRSLFTTNLF